VYLKGFFVLLAALTVVACSSENGPEKQDTAKKDKLQALAKKFKEKDAAQKKEAIEFAKLHNIPLRKELADGSIMELQKIENGIPMYYSTGPNEKNHSETPTEQ